MTTTPPPDQDLIRTQFEQWAFVPARCYDVRRHITGGFAGQYQDPRVERAWQAWQAATTLASQQTENQPQTDARDPDPVTAAPEPETDELLTVDPQYPVGDWRHEILEGNTRLGYFQWVEHQRESGFSEAAEPEKQPQTAASVSAAPEKPQPAEAAPRAPQEPQSAISRHKQRSYYLYDLLMPPETDTPEDLVGNLTPGDVTHIALLTNLGEGAPTHAYCVKSWEFLRADSSGDAMVQLEDLGVLRTYDDEYHTTEVVLVKINHMKVFDIETYYRYQQTGEAAEEADIDTQTELRQLRALAARYPQEVTRLAKEKSQNPVEGG